MTDTTLCHHCETNASFDSCPRCDAPTCEGCFEPSTRFNSGNPQECLACASIRNSAASDAMWERDRQTKELEAAKVARRAKAAERRKTPEAIARRESKKAEKRAEAAEYAKQRNQRLAKVFANLFRNM